MTPEQIKLVQEHFVTVYPVKQELAKVFYDHLFEIDPQVRKLFPEDMAHQREKLADTLAFVVKNLGNAEHLVIAVEGLARRHRGYGVKLEHFGPVGEALVHALNVSTPGGLDEAEQAAWLTAYSVIVGAMSPIMQESAA